MVYRTHTPEETKKVAAEFAASLEGGEVIFLEGELGAGKTTFVQGVAGALGFDGPVRSPTFTLMNRYGVEAGAIREVLHLDLYRIEDPSELTTLALEEELGGAESVSFIEWPMDKLPSGLWKTIRVKIEINGDSRVVTVA
ncbi:tRNA (adenosine(37)-N6)-threonylcarbamoyltransferase complex ATPase subunit type 1 TsaE [Candidatus Uhrbacteria bacterium]|jgi:tRNA threonylcarbamoyladenosine biosynthesis protein TsaE|nr:tRNA (adenosine(37)-N6)-threonylcarbamoyltransferase complex ATPase subunit type 1 TsaE [Candidatus Uhrbacteria bacterium]